MSETAGAETAPGTTREHGEEREKETPPALSTAESFEAEQRHEQAPEKDQPRPQADEERPEEPGMMKQPERKGARAAGFFSRLSSCFMKRSWKFWTVLIALILFLLAVLLVIFLVILPLVVKNRTRETHIEQDSITIKDVTASSFDLEIKGHLLNPSGEKAVVSATDFSVFSAVPVTSQKQQGSRRLDEQKVEEKELGTFTMPRVQVEGKKTPLFFVEKFEVTDTDAFANFAASMMKRREETGGAEDKPFWDLRGTTSVQVAGMEFHNIPIEKTVQFNSGLKGLQDVHVKKFEMIAPSSPGGDSKILSTVSFTVPGHVGVEDLGEVSLGVTARIPGESEGISFGVLKTRGSLMPGENEMRLEGSLSAQQQESENAAVLGRMVEHIFGGGLLEVNARGLNTTQPLFNRAVQQLNMTAEWHPERSGFLRPGGGSGTGGGLSGMVRSFRFVDVVLGGSEEGQQTVPLTGRVEVVVDSPLGPRSVWLDKVQINGDLEADGQLLGKIQGDLTAAGEGSRRALAQTNGGEGDGLEMDLQATIQVSDGGAPFLNFMQRFVQEKEVTLKMTNGWMTVDGRTPLGPLELQRVALNTESQLKGMDGMRGRGESASSLKTKTSNLAFYLNGGNAEPASISGDVSVQYALPKGVSLKHSVQSVTADLQMKEKGAGLLGSVMLNVRIPRTSLGLRDSFTGEFTKATLTTPAGDEGHVRNFMRAMTQGTGATVEMSGSAALTIATPFGPVTVHGVPIHTEHVIGAMGGIFHPDLMKVHNLTISRGTPEALTMTADLEVDYRGDVSVYLGDVDFDLYTPYDPADPETGAPVTAENIQKQASELLFQNDTNNATTVSHLVVESAFNLTGVTIPAEPEPTSQALLDSLNKIPSLNPQWDVQSLNYAVRVGSVSLKGMNLIKGQKSVSEVELSLLPPFKSPPASRRTGSQQLVSRFASKLWSVLLLQAQPLSSGGAFGASLSEFKSHVLLPGSNGTMIEDSQVKLEMSPPSVSVELTMKNNFPVPLTLQNMDVRVYAGTSSGGLQKDWRSEGGFEIAPNGTKTTEPIPLGMPLFSMLRFGSQLRSQGYASGLGTISVDMDQWPVEVDYFASRVDVGLLGGGGQGGGSGGGGAGGLLGGLLGGLGL